VPSPSGYDLGSCARSSPLQRAKLKGGHATSRYRDGGSFFLFLRRQLLALNKAARLFGPCLAAIEDRARRFGAQFDGWRFEWLKPKVKGD
jgi:hypothetical protein